MPNGICSIKHSQRRLIMIFGRGKIKTFLLIVLISWACCIGTILEQQHGIPATVPHLFQCKVPESDSTNIRVNW